MTNEQIKKHEDFVLNGDGIESIFWADTLTIAKKQFPGAVAKGILPLSGNTETAKRRVDGSKAERVFGMKMKGLEEQIVSLVGNYVELAEKGQRQEA